MTEARQAALEEFRSTTHECQHPGCRTLTTQRLCAKHRAPAPACEWAIAARVRDEQEREREREQGGDA